MTLLLRLILRTFAIAIGFYFACLCASLTYTFLSGLVRFDDFATYGNLDTSIALMLSTIGLGSQFASIAFFPALVFIAFAELKNISDWLIYTLVSGAIAFLAPFAFFDQGFDFSASLLYVVSAMLGGLIYWLFVGQRAGNWRNK